MRWVKSELAPDLLQGRLLGLCRRAGLKRAVTLLMCEGLTGPSVVGVLRPAILVPAGWFLNLSPDYVEALLAHELAHVLRHDYAVNLLQSLLEVVLFYHPGVWWLSRRIRAERELACDTFAARLMGDPLPLAEALTALERRGLGHASPELSPAANGGSLMERISHLLLPPHRTSSAPAFGALAILAALLASGLHLVAQTPDPSPVVPPEIPHRTLKVTKVDGKTITERPAIYIHSRNAKDADGKDIPYTQILDIQAHQVALYQLWKVFEEVAKDKRPNMEAWVSKDDKFQGPLVDVDLHGAKPEDVFASLNRLAKQFGVGPYQAPRPSEFGDIYVAKYTNKDGQVVLNLHARQVSTVFLDRLLVTAKDLPPGTSAGFERESEETAGPKFDAIFEGLTLQQLEARVRKLQTEQQ